MIIPMFTKQKNLDTYRKIWSFLEDAYEGSGGFADGTYLDKYPRESDEKFEKRQSIAYYTNLIKPNINKYVGHIYKKLPIRTSDNVFIKNFWDDCDYKGNNINVFMEEFAKKVKLKGVGLILIDMPKNIPLTLKEQLNQRAFPFIRQINPEDVQQIKLDKRGNIEFIIFADTIDLSTPDQENVLNVIRYYDKTKWYVTDNAEYYEEGEHNLGVCPVLLYSENGEFLTKGEFSDAGFLAKRLYNLESELDEILRGQTFSILTIQSDTADDVEINVSVDNALIYPTNTNKPEYIAPPSAPANIYQERIKSLQKQINDIMYNIDTNETRESGIALEIKFDRLNSSLSTTSVKLNDLELKILDVFTRYLKINADYNVSYNTNYNIKDTLKEIQSLETFKALGYKVPTYEKLKLQQIVNNDITNLNPDVIAQIEEEINQAITDSYS